MYIYIFPSINSHYDAIIFVRYYVHYMFDECSKRNFTAIVLRWDLGFDPKGFFIIHIKESGLAYDGAHIYTEACPWYKVFKN